MRRRLQPYATEAATPCHTGCSPMPYRLQPYAVQAAAPCHTGCSPHACKLQVRAAGRRHTVLLHRRRPGRPAMAARCVTLGKLGTLGTLGTLVAATASAGGRTARPHAHTHCVEGDTPRHAATHTGLRCSQCRIRCGCRHGAGERARPLHCRYIAIYMHCG